MPVAVEAMLGLKKVVDDSGLEPKPLELVKLRASQINGCASCLDMHSARMRQRLARIPSGYTSWLPGERLVSTAPGERAALAWCEAPTLLPSTGAADAIYEEPAAHLSTREQVALTAAIVAVNGWKRFAVGFRSPVGSYVSQRHPVRAAKAS